MTHHQLSRELTDRIRQRVAPGDDIPVTVRNLPCIGGPHDGETLVVDSRQELKGVVEFPKHRKWLDDKTFEVHDACVYRIVGDHLEYAHPTRRL